MKRKPLTAPTIIVLVLLVILLARGTFNVYQKWNYAGDVANTAQGEVLRLRARKAELEAQIARLKSPEGVEAELREQYQVGKAGEGVITIVEPVSSSDASSTPEGTVEAMSLWGRVSSWFK